VDKFEVHSLAGSSLFFTLTMCSYFDFKTPGFGGTDPGLLLFGRFFILPV
jgi:hypothetical protein